MVMIMQYDQVPLNSLNRSGHVEGHQIKPKSADQTCFKEKNGSLPKMERRTTACCPSRINITMNTATILLRSHFNQKRDELFRVKHGLLDDKTAGEASKYQSDRPKNWKNQPTRLCC